MNRSLCEKWKKRQSFRHWPADQVAERASHSAKRFSGNSRRGRRYAFTLVEVLVASVLVAVAITGVMGGIRSLAAAQARAQDSDLVQRLASEKINDLTMLADPTQNGTTGDFSDREYPDVTWTADVESTSVTNVDEITVTATRGKVSQSLMTLMYIAPATAAGTTGSAAGGSSAGGAAAGGGGGAGGATGRGG